MSIRPKNFVIIVILVLLSLALAACERERPPVTTPAAATVAPRGTVAPSPTPPAAATQVSLPAAGATPEAAIGATPTAPVAQGVAVTPQGQTGAAQFTYTVEAGDTLAAIAARYDVTQDAIVQLNGLTDPDTLAVGRQLKIPGTGSPGTGATTSTTAGTSVYVVQSGDTLASIARRFGTTLNELVQLNDLANPDRIAVGQKLTVPATGGAAVPSTGTTPSGQQRTHVVAQGDTLLSIARSYGVTVEAIRAANNITDPNLILPGQVLVIP